MMFEELLKQVAHDFKMDMGDLCFSVSTKDFDFPFSFFDFETEDMLGILVTDEEGREKLHIIVKSEIVFLRIHYLDELVQLYGIDEEEHQVHRSYI